MASIVFCWELGFGRGHIAPHISLATALMERGHEVLFALKEVDQAEEILGPYGIGLSP